ncbi:hypothetical protein HMI54_010503 [Coelomomyces lativittatus]|nr:hypothetical protein HMI56_005861 [Coelomomyces lativittatus]KAJ1516184.1 hypothetical protein HMI54_010503 [Coelomomyces lativittatus]
MLSNFTNGTELASAGRHGMVQIAKKKKRTRTVFRVNALPTPTTPVHYTKMSTCPLYHSILGSFVQPPTSLKSSLHISSDKVLGPQTSSDIKTKNVQKSTKVNGTFSESINSTTTLHLSSSKTSSKPCSLSSIPSLSLHISASNIVYSNLPEDQPSYKQCINLELSDYARSLFEWEEKNCLSSHQLSVYSHHPSLERIRRNIIFWQYELNHRHGKFQYPLEVLFLAIQYFDRFVARSLYMIQSQGQFYLLGMVCLSLAAKLSSEYDDPSMSDMIYQLSPWKYSSDEILKFQLLLLKNLNYKLNGYTPLHFLHELLKFEAVQEFISAASKEPVILETVHEQLNGTLAAKIVEPFLKIALRYLVVSLYSSPGTLPSAIALACLNDSIKTRFQQLNCEFLIKVIPQPSFTHSRMADHHDAWMRQFMSISVLKEKVNDEDSI